MIRTYNIRRILAFTIAFIILAFPAAAFAADVSVSADSTSVKEGDTVTLTVVVSGERIAVASGSFTYDPALLTYVSSNGGASDGYINLVSAHKGGSSSLTAIIKFLAKREGTAVVNVKMDSVLNYDEEKLENAEAGVSIEIASSGTPQETGGEENVPEIHLSQTGVPAENVTGAAAQMYIWRSLNSLTLPSGFADMQVLYAGEYVGGAAIPDREDLVLLYLSEDTGENAGYYVYDEDKNILFPYLTVTSVSANFTLIWPDENVQVPEGYEETVFVWKEKNVPAWQAKGSGGSVFLVYARNGAGEKGLYLYNAEDESVQRYVAGPAPEPTVVPTPVPTEQPVPVEPVDNEEISGIVIDPVIAIAACAAGVVMIAAIVVLTILYVKKDSHKSVKKGTHKIRSYAIPEKKDKTVSQ